jgi:hypothetical protein
MQSQQAKSFGVYESALKLQASGADVSISASDVRRTILRCISRLRRKRRSMQDVYLR